MPFEINYDSEKTCMLCRMSGEVDQLLIEDYIRELSSLLKKHKCYYVLNDLRKAELALSKADIYNIPKMFAQSGINLSTKRALVIDTLADNISFFETVSKNRAQNVKIFTDYDEALKWVTADSPVKSK